MRYITGTSFTVRDSRVLRAINASYAEKLKPGTYYILTIRKNSTGVEYSFTNGSSRTSVTFSSIEEADKIIAMLRGEKYP